MAIDPNVLNDYLSLSRGLSGSTSSPSASYYASLPYVPVPSLGGSSKKKKKGKGGGGFWEGPKDLLNSVLYAVDTPRAVITSSVKEIEDALGVTKGENSDVSLGDLIKQIVDQKKRVWGSELLFGDPNKGVDSALLGTGEGLPWLAKAGLGFVTDVGLDPLTYVGGVGLAREGATAVAETAAKTVVQRAGELAAAHSAELGDDVARALETSLRVEQMGVGANSLVGKAIEVAKNAGADDVVAELKGGADVVSRARRFGVSGLSPDEVATYLVNAEGKQIAQRGLAFKLPFSDTSIPLPGSDSPLALKFGEGAGKVRNKVATVTNDRAIGRLFNAEQELTKAARQADNPERAFQAVVTGMARRTGRATTEKLTHDFGIAYAKLVDGMSADGKTALAHMLEGNAGDVPAWAARQLPREAIAEAQAKLPEARDLLDELYRTATNAGANIQSLEDYLPRSLSAETRQVLEDAGMIRRVGVGREGLLSRFEKARSLTYDETRGTYKFMNEEFVAANNSEVSDAVTRILRDRLLAKGVPQEEIEKVADFFSHDLDRVMATYVKSVSRRVGQMNAATRVFNAGAGETTRFADEAVLQVKRQNSVLAATDKVAVAQDHLDTLLAAADPDVDAIDAARKQLASAKGTLTRARKRFQAMLDDRIANPNRPTDVAGTSELSPAEKLDAELYKHKLKFDSAAQEEAARATAVADSLADDVYDQASSGPYLPTIEPDLLRAEAEAKAALVGAVGEDADRYNGMLFSSGQVRAFAGKLDESFDTWRDLEDELGVAIGSGKQSAINAAERALEEHEGLMRSYAELVVHHQQQLTISSSGIAPPLPDAWAQIVRDNIDSIVQDTVTQFQRQIRHGIGTPDEMADLIMSVHRMTDPEQLKGILRQLDRAISFVKRFQIATPGFHVRNDLGGIWQNIALAGMRGQSYEGYYRLVKAIDAGTATAEQERLFELIKVASGSGQIGKEGRRGTDVLRELGANVSPSSPGARLNPLSPDFEPLRWSQKAGEWVEGKNRGALAYDVLTRGGTLDDAVRKVARYHFNYASDALTPFEQHLRRFMPFYTWSRFNLPLQIEMVGRNPKAYARIAQLRANVEAQSEPDQLTPAYFNKLGPAIRLPFRTGDGGHFYLTPDLPMRDLGRVPFGDPRKALPNVVQEVASMVTPIVKAPLEMKMGKQFFNDIPLRDDRAAPLPQPLSRAGWLMDPLKLLWGDRLQQKDGTWYTTERNVYLLTQYLPVLGILRRTLPQETRYQERRVASILSLMGLGTRTNTVEEQQRLLRGEDIRSSNQQQSDRRFALSVQRGGG